MTETTEEIQLAPNTEGNADINIGGEIAALTLHTPNNSLSLKSR